MVMKTRSMEKITTEPMRYLKTTFIVGLSNWIMICSMLSFVQLLPDIGLLFLKRNRRFVSRVIYAVAIK